MVFLVTVAIQDADGAGGIGGACGDRQLIDTLRKRSRSPARLRWARNWSSVTRS